MERAWPTPRIIRLVLRRDCGDDLALRPLQPFRPCQPATGRNGEMGDHLLYRQSAAGSTMGSDGLDLVAQGRSDPAAGHDAGRAAHYRRDDLLRAPSHTVFLLRLVFAAADGGGDICIRRLLRIFARRGDHRAGRVGYRRTQQAA